MRWVLRTIVDENIGRSGVFGQLPCPHNHRAPDPSHDNVRPHVGHAVVRLHPRLGPDFLRDCLIVTFASIASLSRDGGHGGRGGVILSRRVVLRGNGTIVYFPKLPEARKSQTNPSTRGWRLGKLFSSVQHLPFARQRYSVINDQYCSV